jgi:ribosomal protein S18 acetylase RimI-like enzyme
MDIRVFEEQDEAAVIALWQDCGLVVAHNDPRRDIARKLQVGGELFLVGVEKGELVASVMGGYEGHRGWVNYLAVSPAHQRGGYGRLLMQAMECRLLELGCPKLNLQIRSSNEAVIAFYNSIGYAQDPVVSMGKRLISDEN